MHDDGSDGGHLRNATLMAPRTLCVMLVMFASVGIGMGIMDVLYAAQIDDFHRERGDNSAFFRIGARWRGIILIVSGALILFGYSSFRVDTTP